MNELKNIIPDSIDKDESFEIFGFYIFGSKYFTLEIKGKNQSELLKYNATQEKFQ